MDRNAGEVVGAIVSKVSVYLPSYSEIVRSFDQHGSRPESLEANDEMREVKRGFGIEAYRDIFHSVLGLPPRISS